MKVIVIVLGLVVIAYVVYNRLEATKGPATVDANGEVLPVQGATAPKKQLDNVRGAAGRMQQEQEQRAREADTAEK